MRERKVQSKRYYETYRRTFRRDLTARFEKTDTRTCVRLVFAADSAETEARSQYPVVVPCQSILEQNTPEIRRVPMKSDR